MQQFLALLKHTHLDLDAEAIADILWLASQIDPGEVSEAKGLEPVPPVVVEQREEERLPPPLQDDLPTRQPPVSVQLPRSRTQSSTGNSLPFQAPAAPALRNPLELGRSLRPFMRKVPSRTEQTLDEEATAIQIAESAGQRQWIPVFQPTPERWLDLALVVEESRSTVIWQELIAEFQTLLEQQGAFRHLSVWSLRTDQSGKIALFPRAGKSPESPRPRSPKELLDPSGRQLVLLLSDCVSPLWQQGKLYPILKQWSSVEPTAIVQFLPERLWARSRLGLGLPAQLSAFLPGVTNTQLEVANLPVWETVDLPTALVLPIVTLEPASLGPWAQVIGGMGKSQTAGIVFDLAFVEAQSQTRATAGQADLGAEGILQRFRTTASPLARRLAAFMSLVPVSLPIIYLIQEAVLPASRQVHVAEVFMSGLLEAQATLPDSASVEYEFVPGVREPLQRSVAKTEALMVLDKISQYIADRAGLSIRSFAALLEFAAARGTGVDSEVQRFAELSTGVLRRMGGEYAAFVEGMDVDGVVPSVNLQTYEFDVAELEFADAIALAAEDEFITLRSFQFTTVRVDAAGQEIERTRLTSSSFLERLNQEPVSVFISYSAVDKALKSELVRHLNVLQRQGIVQTWDDGEIKAETEWAEAIDGALNTAGIILLLVSADFLASDYCYLEMRRALERHEAGDTLVVPVILRPTYYQGTPFARLQALPEDAKAITEWDNRDEAWSNVVLGIGRAAEQRLVLLEMVQIPGGSFLMGSPEDELKRAKDESPQHTVTIAPFFMGKHPITHAQWSAVAALPQVNRELEPDPSDFKGDDRPVEKVSWFDAVEFCDRLSQLTGRPYRLPSEAEWEYACRASPMPTSATPGSGEVRRAGTTTPFHFGETITPDLANYNWSNTYGTIKITKEKDFEGTTPVGQFSIANAFGLYDMHGNVWEWCQDHWHSNYEGAPTDGSAWIDPEAEKDANRLLRGGSWPFNPRYCRSACRIDDYPGVRYIYNGFRVVCSA